MPPRIDSAGTSLMNSMPWHMPMIGRRLIPRISILVHPSVSDRAVMLIHPGVRTCVRTTAGEDFDSSREFRRLVGADPYATVKGNLDVGKLSRQGSGKKRRQREYDVVSVAVTSALRCSRARYKIFLILRAERLDSNIARAATSRCDSASCANCILGCTSCSSSYHY